jgi:Holliday junction resolvase RusA-like endonuclease
MTSVRQLLPPTHPDSVQAIERELDLMASEITILVNPEELLRKPKTAKARKGFQAREDAFKQEVRQQVADSGRTKFPEPTPVSVQLEIHVPEGGQQPLMAGVVKAYLDALRGIAYDDDRQIQHLVVHRRGLDHPMMDGYDPESSGRPGQVLIVVEPLEAHTKLYDRAFRRLIFRGSEHSPFRNEWTSRDELKLLRLKVERRSISDRGHAQATDDLIAMYEEQRLTSGIFADIDRPGPLAEGTRVASRLIPVHAFQSALRGIAGSRIMLPMRGAGKGSSSVWDREVANRLERHRRHRLMTRAPLRGWVALDIAVRGETIDGMDLDNLARLVITRFENAYCVRPGTVASYRVYQAVGSPEGVQLRIMSDPRMLDLEIALGETRSQMVDRIHGPKGAPNT